MFLVENLTIALANSSSFNHFREKDLIRANSKTTSYDPCYFHHVAWKFWNLVPRNLKNYGPLMFLKNQIKL